MLSVRASTTLKKMTKKPSRGTMSASGSRPSKIGARRMAIAKQICESGMVRLSHQGRLVERTAETNGRELTQGDHRIDLEVLQQPLRRDQPSDFAARSNDLKDDADQNAAPHTVSLAARLTAASEATYNSISPYAAIATPQEIVKTIRAVRRGGSSRSRSAVTTTKTTGVNALSLS